MAALSVCDIPGHVSFAEPHYCIRLFTLYRKKKDCIEQ